MFYTYCDELQNKVHAIKPREKKRHNLTKKQKIALKQLRQLVSQREIRISQANKGGATVVQRVKYYITEANRQLDNEEQYVKLEEDPTKTIAQKSNYLFTRLHKLGTIDQKTLEWGIVDASSVKTHLPYILIHKNKTKPPGRPIVSGINGPSKT